MLKGAEDKGRLLDNYIKVIGYGKVLAVTDMKVSGVSVEVGDIIKLYDRKVLEVDNPKFAAFKDNKYSNSNAHIDPNSPDIQKILHPVHKWYGDEVYKIDPTSKDEIHDYFTFVWDSTQVVSLIKEKDAECLV